MLSAMGSWVLPVGIKLTYAWETFISLQPWNGEVIKLLPLVSDGLSPTSSLMGEVCHNHALSMNILHESVLN